MKAPEGPSGEESGPTDASGVNGPAEPPVDHELAVLHAMGKLPQELLRSWLDASQVTRGLPQLAIAELALREAKGRR